MLIISHRINTVDGLRATPPEYGVEIDVRHDNRNNRLYLNHNPGTGESLDDYLKAFKNAFIIFNIKEAGTEQQCIDLAAQYGIKKSQYFLLDVEFPYLYRATRAGIREIAIRYSEDEAIENALKYKERLDWVWIDTNTTLPLNQTIVKQLEGYKTCLVCPERWGRPQDIRTYASKMQELGFRPTAVMTSKHYAATWKTAFGKNKMRTRWYQDPVYLSIPIIVIIFFIFYNHFFPSANMPDEFLLAQDGIMIKNYIGSALQGHIMSPLPYMYNYQATTIGLIINIYPPLISTIYALMYTIFGISILSARLVHLAFMIAFLMLYYKLLQREYGIEPARWVTALLMLNFSFLQYFGILYREIIYVFFIFLGFYLLENYFRTHNLITLDLFLLTIICGSMTKDFFLLALPAYLFMLLLHTKCKKKQLLYELKTALRWDTITLLLAFFIITIGYYLLKLLTSAKESSFLLGGFSPLGGIILYSKLLLQDAPALIIGLEIALLAITWNYANKRNHQQLQHHTWKYIILSATFLLFLISVHAKDLRYIYLFYPLATLGIVVGISRYQKTLRTTILIIIAMAVTITSAFAINQHLTTQSTFAPENDPQAIQYLQDHNINGRILLLGGYRFDTTYYMRKYNYDLNQGIIDATFEKKSATALAWSRFNTFYQQQPQCQSNFDDNCWATFIKQTNISIILVDTPMLQGQEPIDSYDHDVYRIALELNNTEPHINTNGLQIYLLKS